MQRDVRFKRLYRRLHFLRIFSVLDIGFRGGILCSAYNLAVFSAPRTIMRLIDNQKIDFLTQQFRVLGLHSLTLQVLKRQEYNGAASAM